MNYSTDLIIVGAGLAGLATALSVAEQGLTAVVLEKTSGIGGTSAMSGGWFAFSETPDQRARSITDTDAAFVGDMVEAGGGHVDHMLLESLAEQQHEAYNWLQEQGIAFDVVKLSSGQSKARSHHADIDVVLKTLQRLVLGNDSVDLLLDTAATGLILENGAVRGVQTASTGGNRTTMRARSGVAITTGGFTRAPELIAQFAPIQADAMPYGALGNTGDGLRIALDVGAGHRDTEFISATYGSHPDTTIDEHELLTTFYMGAIIVNTIGRRFADESVSYKELGSAVLTQPGQLAFQLFDSVVKAASQPGVPLSDIDHLERKGRLLKAGTLAELATLMRVDPAVLEETVTRYNTSVVSGNDEFGRTGLCNGVGDLIPVARSPFYAYPAKALMTSTYAGLTVDVEGRVVGMNGAVIPGLYAAGEVVGGYHGTGYVTGSALTKALVCGRVIGRSIRPAVRS